MEPEKLEHLCSMHQFQVAQARAVPCMQCYIDRLTENAALRELYNTALRDVVDECKKNAALRELLVNCKPLEDDDD